MPPTSGSSHTTTATQTPDAMIPDDLVAMLIAEHCGHNRPAHQRLWDYYRNELDFDAGDCHRPYSAAQQQGLPARLTCAPQQATRTVDLGSTRREVVIDNDEAVRSICIVHKGSPLDPYVPPPPPVQEAKEEVV